MNQKTTKRRRILFWLWLVTCLFLLVADDVSRRIGIYYASENFFLELSDGYVAIPFPIGQAPAWGDWGWWVWKPWGEPPEPFGEIIPWIRKSRGIGAMALHVPFWGSFAFLVAFAFFRVVERLPKSLLVNLALLGAMFYLIRVIECCNGRQILPLPRWAFPVVFVVPIISVPSLWVSIRSWIRARRIPWKHCQTCGYNLTGNVSGRCPECGTVVSVPLSSLAIKRKAESVTQTDRAS